MKRILLLLLILPSLVAALDCTYNDQPFIIDKRPSALCIVADTDNIDCYTYLSNPNDSTEIWGGMPERENIDGYGVADSYRVNDGVVHVEFSRLRLYHNHTVTGNVICGSETTSFTFTPLLIDYQAVAEGGLWGKQNVANIAVFTFLIIIVVTIIMLLYQIWKN